MLFLLLSIVLTSYILMRTQRVRVGAMIIVALAVFGLFTTLVPCQYSSYPSVRNRFIATVSAQGGGGSGAGGEDCICFKDGPDDFGDTRSTCGSNCDWDNTGSYVGCGPWWLYPCSGSRGAQLPQ